MMRKNLAGWLGMLLACVMIVTALPLTAWAETPSEQEEMTDPYMQVSFLKLLEGEKLVLSDEMESTTQTARDLNDGVMLNGPISELNAGRVTIAEPFVFDGEHNPVGRISLDAVADRNVFVTAKIYLDDDEEPVVEAELENRSKKDGWDLEGSITFDVYKKIETGEHTVSIGFDVTGKSSVQKTNILLRSIEFAENPGIPVMYFHIDEDQGSIEAMNNDTDHKTQCYGSVDIQVPDGYQSEYEESPSASLEGLELDYIRGRGNSTWTADKKPYKVKLKNKTDLFGMGANKHWVLLANRFDNSLVRNRMTYWLGPQLGLNYTPQCVPVDVVMNGEYYGSYLLCEQIRIGSSRVNIPELKAKDKTEPKITGGYLLSMSPYGDEDKGGMFNTKRGMSLYNEEPDFRENIEPGDDDFYGNDEQKKWIRNYVQKTEDAIFGNDFKNEDEEPYTDYLDLDAAVNYWWVQEFSMNGDAYGSGSTYLYKERDSEEGRGKLFWGPLWDFDYVAWGDLEEIDNLYTEGLTTTRTLWFERMLADPVFTDALTARWPELKRLMEEITEEGGILDQYSEEVKISERYDHEKWGFFDDSWYDEDDQPVPAESSYQDQIDQLKAWINQRSAWVDEHVDELHDLTVTVSFMVDDQLYSQVTALKGWTDINYPKDPEKEGFVFNGWYTEDGEPIPEELTEDLTVYADFIDEEEAIKAENIYFQRDSVWLDINDRDAEGLLYNQDYTLVPYDAQDRRIEWSSSDETVATVDENGLVTCHAVGTARITAVLKSGAEESYLITVYDSKVTRPVDAEELLLEDSEVTLKFDEYYKNPLAILPEDEVLKPGYLFYESEDESIASVDGCGVVTGVSPGETTITVRFMQEDKDYEDCIEAAYTVIVEDDGSYEDLDAVDQAIFVLMQLNSLVVRSEYTTDSYAAYREAYSYAMHSLRNDRLTADEIKELRHMVIEAQLNLVKKSANTLKVKAGKIVNIKVSRLKKKAQTVKRSRVLRVSKAKGKVTYKLLGVSKARKYFSVNAKTGKITIKKGLKKGLYKVKIKVTAAGNGNYKAGSKTVTVKIRVK